ncbi:hypothetical protein G4B88_017841 [Cannabis sativa]|uniref:Zinc knuckle CX2CX4HX4C domain-containing protein n=1 Tax=Cannabis sativa TaxID=3483 RepID=A0A7J6GRR4_CANSA|nr:hypothetical protein G4B88_017841 [Cannabis sativa]
MTPLEAGSVVTTDMLTSTPFWVQVSGIPFLKRSRALAQRLGEVLGRLIEVDTASLKETWGPYLRVRIEIDVTQPLPRGTDFHFHGMAGPVWHEFCFENLPDFCHYCGRLSHIVNHCHEFLAKWDSSSAPPFLHYDQSLGAKIRITSNPFCIACSRTRQRPHIANPTSLAPTPPYRLHQPPVISKGLFNEPTSAYGVQHLSQPQTTPLGFYMAHSSSNVVTSHTHNLNQPPLTTTTWLYPQTSVTATQTAHTKGASNVLCQSNTIPSIPLPFPPITTAEQLATPLPMDVSTSADTIVATNGASQHVLHPLYPLGNPFTWTNRQKQPSHTQERLNWCLSNSDWDANFPNPRLCHGDFFGSDHRSLILTLHHPTDQSKHVPKFIFDRLWMSAPGFEDCLLDAWTLKNHNHHSNPLIGFNEKFYNYSSRLKQ